MSARRQTIHMYITDWQNAVEEVCASGSEQCVGWQLRCARMCLKVRASSVCKTDDGEFLCVVDKVGVTGIKQWSARGVLTFGRT